MPKLGMKPVRQRQLIDATLASVEQLGMQATTINSISRIAGVSTGIINHYFGGKQGLVEATVRFLLSSLHDELMKQLITVGEHDHRGRLGAIVQANFAEIQTAENSAKTWLAFWSQAMHDGQLANLQHVNERRLHSNLKYSFKHLLQPEYVEEAAQSTAALIDGLWLRRALSRKPIPEAHSADYCLNHVDRLIERYGIHSNLHPNTKGQLS